VLCIGSTEAHGPQGATWVSVAASLMPLAFKCLSRSFCAASLIQISAIKIHTAQSLVGRSVSPRAAERSLLPTLAWSGKAVHE